MRKYQEENVYEAFNKRLDYICNYFDHLIVSFSGGKDSGVMLELVHRYYEENELEAKGVKVSVYYLDYEGNYQETKDYIERSMENILVLTIITSVCLFQLLVAYQCLNQLGCLGIRNIQNSG